MCHSLSPVLAGSGSAGIISARLPCGIRHPGNRKAGCQRGVEKHRLKNRLFLVAPPREFVILRARFSRRPHRSAVRTPGFHPGNTGSIPVGVTILQKQPPLSERLFCFLDLHNLWRRRFQGLGNGYSCDFFNSRIRSRRSLAAAFRLAGIDLIGRSLGSSSPPTIEAPPST